MANKYNAEGYYSPTEYEALTNIEKEEKAANFRPIVYICSPYSGNVNHNIEMARKYCRFAVDKHYLPIAPHLLFTQFMNDESVPKCGFSEMLSQQVCRLKSTVRNTST